VATSLVFDILARDRASATFTRTGRSADRAGDQVARSSTAMRAWGRAAGFIAAGGALVLGRALIEMGKGAAADEAAQNRLALSLRNAARATDGQVAATESWITAQGKALGVADDDLRPALSRLAVATGDVDKAQRLAALGMDISAGTGKSLEAVTTALAKAQAGNLGGLGRLGIATKNADGSTKSLKQITKELADTYKGQAATGASTLDGKMKRLNLILDESKETIGGKLIPVASELGEWMLTDGVNGAQQVGAAYQRLSQWVRDNSTALTALAIVIGTVTAVTKLHAAVLTVQAAGGLLKYLAATKLVSATTAAWTAVQWAINVALTANPIGLVVVGLGLLVGGLILAYKKSVTFRNVVSAALDAVGAAGRFLWNNIYGPILKLFIKTLGQVMVTFGKMLQVIGRVPGFGWVGDLGDKAVGAGKKADELSRRIKDIPSKRSVTIDVSVTGRESIRAAEEEIRRLKAAGGGGGTVNSSGGDPGNQAYRRTGATG